MLRRRALPFVALVALVAAGPAAAFTGGEGISDVLRAGGVSTKQTTRTCQAGRHRGGVTKSTLLLGEKTKPGVEACEEPPKSSVITPDSIAKATAAALAILG